MENKKINVFFYLVVGFFLVLIFLLIKDFNVNRANEYRAYTVNIANIVKEKNNKIRLLFNVLIAKERENVDLKKENADLKNALTETRNDLESLTKKLAPPTPVAVPAAMPAPAAAAK